MVGHHPRGVAHLPRHGALRGRLSLRLVLRVPLWAEVFFARRVVLALGRRERLADLVGTTCWLVIGLATKSLASILSMRVTNSGSREYDVTTTMGSTCLPRAVRAGYFSRTARSTVSPRATMGGAPSVAGICMSSSA
jgi:hypothetical protein